MGFCFAAGEVTTGRPLNGRKRRQTVAGDFGYSDSKPKRMLMPPNKNVLVRIAYIALFINTRVISGILPERLCIEAVGVRSKGPTLDFTIHSKVALATENMPIVMRFSHIQTAPRRVGCLV